MVSPDLVGREPQLGQLVEALSRAHAGLPGTVLLPGEAGVGKTRLLREFLAVARQRGATAVSGACMEVSAGDLPFVPFRGVLREMVRGRPEHECERLLGATWRDLHVLLPELAPAQASGEARGTPHAFDVMAAVVEALTRESPLVLAIDDAQWADQSTLQLLRYLHPADSRRPLLLVVAYRSEELPPDAARRKAFEELSRSADDVIAVSPLTHEQVAALVETIGAELSPTSLSRLQDRCGGLPFLVEELVSAERDGLTRGIPRRVRDVVRLRAGALSADAQLVTTLVAVAARPLRHRVLQHAVNLPSRRFADALAESLSARLLTTDVDIRTYAFHHDVAREIVHDDLFPASRIDLHFRLAVALQSDLRVDAYAGRLCEVAHHWLQTDAHEEHALRASLLAARASTRDHAHPEALRQYANALRMWSRVDDAELISGTDFVTLSIEAAESGHWAGDTGAALRHVDGALATVGSDDSALVTVLHERRTHYSWLDSGRLDRGGDTLARLGSAATRERMRASDLMQAGRYADSLAPAQAAVDLAHAAGVTGDEIRAGIILGVGLAFTGHPDAGIATIESARVRAMRDGSAEEVVAAHVNMAFVLLGVGNMEKAAEVALAGLREAITRGVGGSDGAILAGNAAEALARLGRLDEAAKVVHDGLTHHPPPALRSFLMLTGAEVDVLRGRLSDGAAALDDIVERGLLDDFQFQQQMRAVEAELQLWDPASSRHWVLDDLRAGLGSSIAADAGDEDVLLTARLLWLGVRADADSRSRAEVSADAARLQALVADGEGLCDRAGALPLRVEAVGVRQQLDRYLHLIEGEMSRLRAEPDPGPWERAARRAADDPYLMAYALWRKGSALRALRRRREATQAFREAHQVADRTGLRAVVSAVVAAAHSLGIGLDHTADLRPSRPDRPFNLTTRELEVLGLLVRGATNRRIATALRMTEKTASVHVSHILTKLSVNSRGEAVARAYEVGLARSPVNTGD